MVRVAFVFSALLISSSAFACAMRQREEVSLTQAMDDIDAPTAKPQPTVIPEVAATPTPTPTPSSLWSTVTATIAEAVIPEREAKKSRSMAPPTAMAK